jgi:uncharacterized protein (TIGR03067 family)
MFSRGLLVLPVCLFLITGTASSGDKKEQEKLEGTWKSTSFTKSGKKEEDKQKGITATFKGDKVTVKFGDKAMEATYTVDPTKKPKTMDVTAKMGDKKETLLMVYELDGDTLTVSHFDGEMATKERPKNFEATKDTVVVTFKRDKK